jgi:hypothetical protein
VGCGDIAPKGALERFDENGVTFADGTHEDIDAVVWATGYNVSFPFFDDRTLQPVDNRFPLFKRMIKPGHENLIFLALAQPLPTLVNFAEQQSKLVAALMMGTYELPADVDMQRITGVDEQAHMGHFYAAARHTMQVDFNTYVKDLTKEIERGRKRAKATA